MIRINHTPHLGDKISGHAFARILAKRFGYRLDAVPILGFPGTMAVMEGDEVLSRPCVWSGQWPMESLSGRRVPAGDLREQAGSAITLEGMFLRYDLFSDAVAEIKDHWFKLADPLPTRSSDEFVCCLHASPVSAERSGEHGAVELSDGSELSEAEIRRLHARVKPKRFHLVANSHEHPRIEALADLNPEVFTGSDLEAFRWIHSFQKVAFSQNTLAWWAAFLGSAREIYFPKVDRGYWSHPSPANLAHEPWWHGIDLRPAGDPRFIFDW